MVVGGWLQLHARQEASGGGVEVEGVGIEDTFPSRLIAVRVHVCHCVGIPRLIACARRESPICMDRGARREKGEEGRERRNRCKKIVDAKMRFAKTRPVFPCAAHANSFTRVPGRNAASG